MNLVAIKVEIHSDKGKCLYPDFNQLQVVKDSGLDWSQYIDQEGSGWLYDKKCGHAEVDADSPAGVWMGMLLIPEVFAVQAIEAFPDRITRLDFNQSEKFYNERHSVRMPDEDIDSEILGRIKAKQDLGLPLTAEQNKALDPEDDTPGIRKNKNKKFADYVATRDIAVAHNV